MLLHLAVASAIHIYAYVSIPELGIVIPSPGTCIGIVLRGNGEIPEHRVVCSNAVLPLERGGSQTMRV